MRSRVWKGATKTPAEGTIRLGTWREILPEDYRRFKSMFPKRNFYLMTRGLLPFEFYEEVNSDPFCFSIQVAVDIIDSQPIPPKERLREFTRLSKVLYRFKPLPENAQSFLALAQEVGIPHCRILEQAHRLPHGHKLYEPTPLLKYLPKDSYFRCNTKCKDCRKENGVTVCAVNMEKYFSLPRFKQTG